MLEIPFALSVFLLGLIVGSFLNVVILRYNTGRSFTAGRSICFACGKLLHWFENIPVLSYVLLRGACRGCKSKISIQYPLIEIATGLLFLAAWLSVTGAMDHGLWTTDFSRLGTDVIIPTLFYFAAFSLLVIIFVYDFYHKIIPDVFSYSFAALALTGLIVAGYLSGVDTVFWLDLAAGPILFIPFWALWYFSGGTWMGLGDGKLVLGIGWFLGLVNGVSAVVLAFWVGAVAAIILLVLQSLNIRIPILGELGRKSAIPFGPFLVIGTITQFFYALDLLLLSAFI
ncbi:MAG: prepilin peptidase [Candidatus Paceibacterota bacterium]